MEKTSATRRACAECKAKKLRCVASREEPGVCHRCYQQEKDCTFPEARPRKRQSRLHNRMSQLEEMMGSLVDRLPEPSQHRIISDSTPATFTISSGFSEPTSANQDPLTCGLVTFPEAESLCQIYRRMSHQHFPCVIVPERLGVLELQQERPMLLQAMLVVASWQNKPRQIALEKFYVRDLGLRFFNGERSLDILQGLLAYLAWYHFNVTESGQYHAYRLASLCVTMIYDLGFNKKPPQGTTQHDLILNSRPAAEQMTPHTLAFWSHEARRALIGAYIQSTLCALMCRKQSPIAYSTYMEQCALSLQEDSETPTDTTLIYFIKLLRIINEVYSVFDYGDPDHSLSMGDDKVQMVVKALEAQLHSWRESIPPGLSQHAQLNTWGDLAGAYAHEIGLHGNLRNRPFSATRVAIMFDCLAHVEDYLKHALSISVSEMQTWTAFDWRQLTYTIMLASKISVSIDAIASDKESTARIARLDSYLGVVYTRTQELFAMTSTPQGQTHYFHSLLNQWKGIRSWYQTVLQKRTATHLSEQTNRSIGETSIATPNDPPSQLQATTFRPPQTLDSWPDDNFGILPMSTADFMMLESLEYP